ncbi:MAG: class I SAM-dependent methyltransferase, partial [Deltaproteobacteria bacterium]|nr:class I SAM-dependent methyltransferase [Deltaproteobacteria bacterium]
MSITQKKRAKIIADAYRNWGVEGKKALDVGCGNGVVSDVLAAELGLNLCGTDIIDYRTTNIPFKQMENPAEL